MNLCGKEFKSQNLLSRHEGIHTGLKPFKCDICKKNRFHYHTICPNIFEFILESNPSNVTFVKNHSLTLVDFLTIWKFIAESNQYIQMWHLSKIWDLIEAYPNSYCYRLKVFGKGFNKKNHNFKTSNIHNFKICIIIHLFKISFLTKFTFLKSHFLP